MAEVELSQKESLDVGAVVLLARIVRSGDGLVMPEDYHLRRLRMSGLVMTREDRSIPTPAGAERLRQAVVVPAYIGHCGTCGAFFKAADLPGPADEVAAQMMAAVRKGCPDCGARTNIFVSQAANAVAWWVTEGRHEQFLTTCWSVDTRQGHEIEVLHRSMPWIGAAHGAKDCSSVERVDLLPDGTLLAVVGGVSQVISETDIIVRVYTRPMRERGAAFIPDNSTEEGRAKIAATLSDPAYVARPDEFQVVALPLSTLAAVPGAVGRLGSLAYGSGSRQQFREARAGGVPMECGTCADGADICTNPVGCDNTHSGWTPRPVSAGAR